MRQHEPPPQLERVQTGRGNRTLPRGLVWLGIVALAFLVGLSLGMRMTPGPSPSPSSSVPPAVEGAQVSRALSNAFLNRGSPGWGLCLVAAEITCRPIAAAPDSLFARFGALPLAVSAQDWIVLSPITVPPGHYILAGPTVALLEPQVTFASVTADGVGTFIGPVTQPTWNGTVWADLGELGQGRYVAVVTAYGLSSSDPQGRSTTQLLEWGLGFAVNGSP
jgi:hypothetical protein